MNGTYEWGIRGGFRKLVERELGCSTDDNTAALV